jgi:hypothetical protein
VCFSTPCRNLVSVAYFHRRQALYSSLGQDTLGPGGGINSGTVETHLIQILEDMPIDDVIERPADSTENIMMI